MDLRRTVRTIGAASLLAILAYEGWMFCGRALAGDQQSAPPADATLFRVNSNLITVPVSVTDAAGQPVRDLQLRDFALDENGNPEALARLSEPGQTPIELALILDLSGSVRPEFELERQAAARFLLRVLRPEDRFSLYSIGPRPELLQGYAANVEQGLRSLAALQPSSGATAFYDTVVLAAHSLAAEKILGCRKVEVVLSDGEDNNSESWDLGDALQEVQRADCVFYSINPAGPSLRLNKVSIAGQEGLDRLAAQSGGTAFVLESVDELNPIFDRIAAELRAQYLLEYYSSDQRRDGSFRRIRVFVPTRPGLHIHARLGYYASQG